MILAGAHLEKQLRGEYAISRRIGSGAMGEVWAAVEMAFERKVAIKVLNEALSGDVGYRERFRGETALLAKLRHPRIVRLLTAGQLEEDENLYMVMEFVTGRTLWTILGELRDKGRVLDPVSAVFYAFQMLDGLRAAHENRIVHRDVKPANMIINDDGELTLLDFGVAKAVDVTGPRREGTGAGRRKTKKSTLLGTPRFMAPELIAHGTFDPRSDLYPVGIILVMMLTGEYPYVVDPHDESGILDAHVSQEPILREENNPECPEEVWALTRELLAKDPAQRFQSADKACEALSAFLRSGSVPPDHPVAKKLEAERAAQAHRRAYEKRGVPSRRPAAPTPPRAIEKTAPLRAGAAPVSPCAPALSAVVADATAPIAPGTTPPRMMAPYPLARPRSELTQEMPVGRLPTGLPSWIAPARRREPEPKPEPTAMPRWRLRPKRWVLVTGITGAVLVTWAAAVMMASWRARGMEEQATGAAATATATTKTTATVTAVVTAAPAPVATVEASARTNTRTSASTSASTSTSTSTKAAATVTALPPASPRRGLPF